MLQKCKIKFNFRMMSVPEVLYSIDDVICSNLRCLKVSICYDHRFPAFIVKLLIWQLTRRLLTAMYIFSELYLWHK